MTHSQPGRQLGLELGRKMPQRRYFGAAVATVAKIKRTLPKTLMSMLKHYSSHHT